MNLVNYARERLLYRLSLFNAHAMILIFLISMKLLKPTTTVLAHAVSRVAPRIKTGYPDGIKLVTLAE